MNEKPDRDVMSVDGAEPAAKPARPIAPQQGGSFLAGFLAEQNTADMDHGAAEDPAADTGGTIADTPAKTPEDLQERAIGVLRQIFDPEIPVNIYDLGLIYGVDVGDDMIITVTMTLTSPHCPVAEIMPGEVEVKTNAIAGAKGSEVKLVWDPPWDFTKMTDEARLELGLL